jgi:hypothetical protein
MNDFHGVTPILNVKNFAASMDYYVHKLGFQKKVGLGQSSDLRLRHPRPCQPVPVQGRAR